MHNCMVECADQGRAVTIMDIISDIAVNFMSMLPQVTLMNNINAS